MVEIRSAYGVKTRTEYVDTLPSMTKQSFKDECDVNHIIKRFKKSGVITHLSDMEAQYGDLTGLDFQAAMDLVTQANHLFDELPASVRKRFANDPAMFLDFMDNPENAEEMVKLGLATRKEVDTLNRVPEPPSEPTEPPPTEEP